MKGILSIFVTITLVLFVHYALSQPTLLLYCVATTTSNTIVKGRCGSFNSDGEFIKKITIKDSLNRKVKLDARSIRLLLSSEKPFSTMDQLDDKKGLVFEQLIIDNKKMGLAQLLNWKTETKLKVFYGPVIDKGAVPKGLLGMEEGFQYEEQAFWILKLESNSLLVSKNNFEVELDLLFADCPSFHPIFKKTKAKYKELLTYTNDYNRLCLE